jgi:hypothetical protein
MAQLIRLWLDGKRCFQPVRPYPGSIAWLGEQDWSAARAYQGAVERFSGSHPSAWAGPAAITGRGGLRFLTDIFLPGLTV